MKKHHFLLLLALLLAGNAAGQTTDSAYMQGEIKEVKVRSPYAKWKEDSARNRLIYKKELADAVFKPIVSLNNGIQLDGFFSNLALIISGKKKRYQKFKAEIERNEREDFSSIRYTPAVVTRVTGLEDSAAVVSIKQNPMPRNFLVAATELEFLQWIRDRQKGHP